jgi:hypothetical protein
LLPVAAKSASVAAADSHRTRAGRAALLRIARVDSTFHLRRRILDTEEQRKKNDKNDQRE